MNALHPAAPHDLPPFIAASDGSDTLMVAMAVFIVLVVFMVGVLFLRLHTLPERIAHRGHKLQLEIVAILGLLALFTHIHLFWVAGLLLAVIDLPDFGSPLTRIAKALERMAGQPSTDEAAALAEEGTAPPDEAPPASPLPGDPGKDGAGRQDLVHA